MKEIKVDFNNEFISNIAQSLNIKMDDTYITTDEWARLQGTISSCVICYYFSKMHMLAIKNALEKKCGRNGNYRRLDDTTVKEYIDIVEEEKEKTGTIPLAKRVIPTFRLTPENYEEYRKCVEKIDTEFENHQELIELVAQKPIHYLEEEIASRKAMKNYEDLNHHLANVSDYYTLQNIGIESYIDKRRTSQQVENMTIKKAI